MHCADAYMFTEMRLKWVEIPVQNGEHFYMKFL